MVATLQSSALPGLVTHTIGDSWINDLSQLRKLKAFTGDSNFRDEFMNAKHSAKAKLL